MTQGEGKYTGYPTTFVRLHKCNLNCAFCFTENTLITTPDGKVKIKDLKVGDAVLSYSGKTVKLDTVKNVFKREVSREALLHLKMNTKNAEYKNIYVTKNHEFFVKGMWIRADQLKVGDEIYTIDFQQWKMKNNNPMFNELSIEKSDKVCRNIEENICHNGLKVLEINEVTERQMARWGNKNTAYVYNIETGNHNYFANSVLAHNCDTKYAMQKRKKKMSIVTLCNYISRMKNEHVCITGGEPLLQDDTLPLVYELLTKGYKINIETNGSIFIDSSYKRSFSYTMDIKCPSSKMENYNRYDNLENLQTVDEVKFVIANEKDYVFAKEVIAKYPTYASFIFSPIFGEKVDSIKLSNKIAQWLLEDKIPRARLGIQMHKLLNIY